MCIKLLYCIFVLYFQQLQPIFFSIFNLWKKKFGILTVVFPATLKKLPDAECEANDNADYSNFIRRLDRIDQR